MYDLVDLEGGHEKTGAFHEDYEAYFVEEYAEKEGPHHCLEHSQLVSFQILQVEMSVQKLMH